MSFSYTKTVDTHSAHFAMTLTVNEKANGSGLSATVTAAGNADLSAHTYDMTLNAPQLSNEEFRVVGSTLYLHTPPGERGQVPGGKPWVSLDLSRLSPSTTAQPASAFSGVAGQDPDPLQPLAYLQSIAHSVTSEGTAMVDGVKTIHYAITIDLDAAISRQPNAQLRSQLRSEEQALGAHTLPADVWLDPDGLVRRERITVPVPSPSASPGQASSATAGQVTTTIDFSAFGAPVNITPPPADQTADLTDQALGATPATGTGATTTAPTP